MKRINILSIAWAIACILSIASCSSNDDEPKPEEKTVNEQAFRTAVDNKVWCFDPEAKTVYVNSKGEEFYSPDLDFAGGSLLGLSFKDGKLALLIWPMRSQYRDFRIDEQSGDLFINNYFHFTIESFSEDRIVIRDMQDALPKGMGKPSDEYTFEDFDSDEGSYRRVTMKVADAETAAEYLFAFTEQ